MYLVRAPPETPIFRAQTALAALRIEIPDWDARIEKERLARLEGVETKRGPPVGSQNAAKHKEINSTNCRINSQQDRAEQNKVGIVTQRKLDRLAKEPPDLFPQRTSRTNRSRRGAG